METASITPRYEARRGYEARRANMSCNRNSKRKIEMLLHLFFVPVGVFTLVAAAIPMAAWSR